MQLWGQPGLQSESLSQDKNATVMAQWKNTCLTFEGLCFHSPELKFKKENSENKSEKECINEKM